MAEEKFLLKEALFSREQVKAYADALRDAHPGFDRDRFLKSVLDGSWHALELKQRMRHITTALHGLLPAEYPAALDILMRAADTPLPGTSFVGLVASDYVSVYGLDNPDISISALEFFTQRISAEFAVRPFLLRYPERMMAQMLAWAEHTSEEVRRLASEGSRPRLPWGTGIPALKRDPSPIVPILDRLRHDPSETVRRSVANNLNDISKDNPDVTIDLLRRWQDGTLEVTEITHHALRTLIKQGHPDALNLLGYTHGAEVVVRNLRVEPATIPMGGELHFSFDIESTGETSQELVIDYVVCFMKSNGKQNPKVFKLAKRTISPGEVVSIRKTQSLRPITTRKYYPGKHSIAPKINGQVYDAVSFVVKEGA
jgi:3-methyladenine DNA glycosylase AlkC